jgi:hypothetical protein
VTGRGDGPAAMPSQFAYSVAFGGGHIVIKTMENRAARYRNIAAKVRASAGNLSDERTRKGMLMAAEVWERLATLAEESVPLPLQAHTPHLNT